MKLWILIVALQIGLFSVQAYSANYYPRPTYQQGGVQQGQTPSYSQLGVPAPINIQQLGAQPTFNPVQQQSNIQGIPIGNQQGVQQGYNPGIQQGNQIGVQQGYNPNIQQGYNPGIQQGNQIGVQQGYPIGVQQGGIQGIPINQFQNAPGNIIQQTNYPYGTQQIIPQVSQIGNRPAPGPIRFPQ